MSQFPRPQMQEIGKSADSLPSRRADRCELRALKRRLRPLRRSLACRLGSHEYVFGTGGRLGFCRYCYTPETYIGWGLLHRLERWRDAVDEAEADGVIA